MPAASLQLLFISNPFYKALKTLAPPPLNTLTMKDRPPPSSYGSLYIPPHHRRLRSVITTASSASPPQPVVSPVHNAEPKNSSNNNSNDDNNNSSSIKSGKTQNPYPYLPYHQLQQLEQQKQRKEPQNEVTGEASVPEMEIPIHTVSYCFAFSLRLLCTWLK